MSATFDSTGLTVQSYQEIFDELAAEFKASFGAGTRTELSSSFGQLIRIMALLEAQDQELLLLVHQSFDPRLATGATLDRQASLLGVTRIPEFEAEVTGDLVGTAATVVPDGTRMQYDPTGSTWVVIDGPYTIGGGGTVAARLRAEETGATPVALDPDSGFDEWTVLDVVAGLDGFESQAQPLAGDDVETDEALRARMEVERYARGQGPLAAIRAAVSAVEGVEYVQAWQNTTLVTDADGIPGKAVNVIVEGGDDDEVAAAIWSAMPAGIQAYGTDVDTTVTDASGLEQPVAFDRVTDVDLHVRVTLTTSTSEETAPADLEDAVEDAILEYTAENWSIGTDVLVYRLVGAVVAADIPGIDHVVIETSLDGSSWSTAKRTIDLRSRAVLTAARVTFLPAV